MSVLKESYGKTSNGDEVSIYTLANGYGTKVSLIDYGAVITNIFTPDKNKKIEDVVLGFDSIKDYETNIPSFGAFIGRCANRISDGGFTLNNKFYKLDQNDDTNCLHGGFLRYNCMMYDAEYGNDETGSWVRFSRLSPDGEQGFPGNLSLSITYTLTDISSLIIRYNAVCDEDTVVNLTNHSYFNIGVGGEAAENIYSLEAKIYADKYTPVAEKILPSGEILPVAGTVFDFSEFKRIDKDLNLDSSSDSYLPGYDHNFVLNNSDGSLQKAAEIYCPENGRCMTVFTDLPGVQLYTAPELSITGKSGHHYGCSAALCLETQDFPNAINTPTFPSTLLKAGEEYEHTTVYEFSVI